MPVLTFFKGALAGGVGATAVLAATAAFAGTGVGGVLNLGQTNSVNQATSLTGAAAGGAQLQVTNTSTVAGSTGLTIRSAQGKPPFTVGNQVQVPNLNATLLAGRAANGLNRVSLGSETSLSSGATFDPLTTVAITAPSSGFVRLDGQLLIVGSCGDCSVFVRVHDDSTGDDSPVSYWSLGRGDQYVADTVPVEWVFPVTAGTHTYSLSAGQVSPTDGTMGLYNPQLAAQYVPFGGTGLPNSLGASKVRTSAHPLEVGED